MPFQRKPLIGAVVIGTFITACVGWLFYGVGKPVPLWGYPLVFAGFVILLYGIGRLLVGPGRSAGRVRSVDILSEVN